MSNVKSVLLIHVAKNITPSVFYYKSFQPILHILKEVGSVINVSILYVNITIGEIGVDIT